MNSGQIQGERNHKSAPLAARRMYEACVEYKRRAFLLRNWDSCVFGIISLSLFAGALGKSAVCVRLTLL